MPKELKLLQVIALVIIAAIYMGVKNLPIAKSVTVIAPTEESYYVERVVDGDTLKLSNKERVRLIGVDTPEVHYSDKLVRDAKKSGKDVKTIQALGERASNFTKSLCANKKVRLEFDVRKKDKYGRLLAYVYLEDGTFVNARIIEEGYAQVMTVPPNVKHAEDFRKLEKQARDAKKGLWNVY